MLFADDLARASWRCIHFAQAGDVTDDLRRDLAAREIAVFELSAAAIHGKDELMRALADALKLPGWFGRNWDALLDCLRNLPDSVPVDGYVLLIHDGPQLWRRAPALAGALVETWLIAAEEAAHDEMALHLVFLEPAETGAPKG